MTKPVTSRTPDLQDPQVFAERFLDNLQLGQGIDLPHSTPHDQYLALARTVRGALAPRWLETNNAIAATGAKTVCYLSAEYLLGRQLENALLSSGLTESARAALGLLGLDFDTVKDQEIEPGLGNGGLGRLAACFMDSTAAHGVSAIGYGIRYEYGIFRQEFVDGYQRETPDNWLAMGNPWEFPHREVSIPVGFGGRTIRTTDEAGVERVEWEPAWQVLGVPYNYLVPGYGTETVNCLRLWNARATAEFDLKIFNAGDYAAAVRAQTQASNISKVLYPEDSTIQGKELRLQQQYFFVACSIRDFLNSLPEDFDYAKLGERVIFQLNDTHPVIGVPELMRILIDEKGMDFASAWAITQQCFAYTCHTLLPEALEVWPVWMMERLLPRHMELIYDINAAFLADLREAYPGDEWRVHRMSIIQEHPERAVRMAYLATVAGAKVNGVAALHSDLLRTKVLTDFSELWPEKFTNVTNGVTPRRFVALSNPGLTALITEAIGEGWLSDLERLRELEPFADDASFRERFAAIKMANKVTAAEVLAKRNGFDVDPNTLVDVMVKRLHEYKRQSLKLLHAVVLHQRLQDGLDITPRTIVFGAKAAPGYQIAKETIGMINGVARVIDADPRARGKLKIVFPPNYNVTLAERVIPAADLSEQISQAGKEASGTGNMKFALNGALTIGTLDGANVEIRDLVGEDNFFLFGMDEVEVSELGARGYNPMEFIERSPVLSRAMTALLDGTYSDGDIHRYGGVIGSLMYHDRFMAMADFDSYIAAQDRVEVAYADQDAWVRSAVLNVARSGFFSSDRSIQDYLDRIWHAEPIKYNR